MGLPIQMQTVKTIVDIVMTHGCWSISRPLKDGERWLSVKKSDDLDDARTIEKLEIDPPVLAR